MRINTHLTAWKKLDESNYVEMQLNTEIFYLGGSQSGRELRFISDGPTLKML